MQNIALRVRLQESQKKRRDKKRETNGKLFYIETNTYFYILCDAEKRKKNCNSNNNKIIKSSFSFIHCLRLFPPSQPIFSSSVLSLAILLTNTFFLEYVFFSSLFFFRWVCNKIHFSRYKKKCSKKKDAQNK